MAITIQSLRTSYLDGMFFRCSKKVLSLNGKYSFTTYAVTKEDFEDMFKNVLECNKVFSSTVGEDTIHFCKREDRVTCHNLTTDERVAFLVIC